MSICEHVYVYMYLFAHSFMRIYIHMFLDTYTNTYVFRASVGPVRAIVQAHVKTNNFLH